MRVTATRDNLGRPGVAVAGGALTLIFDPRTGALRSDTTGAIFDQGTAGTIIAQGPVLGLDAIPRGLTPIRSLIGHPPAITITPATDRDALHDVHRPARRPQHLDRHSARSRSRRRDVRTHRAELHLWVSRPPPHVRIAASTIIHRPHITLATYRITPAAIGHRVWCPGRYQLMLSPLDRSPGHDCPLHTAQWSGKRPVWIRTGGRGAGLREPAPRSACQLRPVAAIACRWGCALWFPVPGDGC